MSASTVDPALAETDPAGYVEAVAALAINDEDPRWREQAALWRGVVERHGKPGHRLCDAGHWKRDARRRVRTWVSESCPDLLAVVAAARAYADGGA